MVVEDLFKLYPTLSIQEFKRGRIIEVSGEVDSKDFYFKLEDQVGSLGIGGADPELEPIKFASLPQNESELGFGTDHEFCTIFIRLYRACKK